MFEFDSFMYDENEIRVINKNGDPWFVGKDICNVLSLGDVSTALSRVDDDEKDTASIRTPGGIQLMLIVSEPGVYDLVFTSRKPTAKILKKWVTKEVIPTIRKTGSYTLKNKTQAELLLEQAQLLVNLEKKTNLLDERSLEMNKTISAHEDRLKEIENTSEEAKQWLFEQQFDAPESWPKKLDVTPRAMLNRLVRAYAAAFNMSYQDVWNLLYKELYYRCHYNPKVRAKNTKLSPLAQVEKDGFILDLWLIACHILLKPLKNIA